MILILLVSNSILLDVSVAWSACVRMFELPQAILGMALALK